MKALGEQVFHRKLAGNSINDWPFLNFDFQCWVETCFVSLDLHLFVQIHVYLLTNMDYGLLMSALIRAFAVLVSAAVFLF